MIIGLSDERLKDVTSTRTCDRILEYVGGAPGKAEQTARRSIINQEPSRDGILEQDLLQRIARVEDGYGYLHRGAWHGTLRAEVAGHFQLDLLRPTQEAGEQIDRQRNHQRQQLTAQAEEGSEQEAIKDETKEYSAIHNRPVVGDTQRQSGGVI
jgi:hypothetical protein